MNVSLFRWQINRLMDLIITNFDISRNVDQPYSSPIFSHLKKESNIYSLSFSRAASYTRVTSVYYDPGLFAI